MRTGPQLRRIALGDAPEAWARLGFAVEGSACRIGAVTLDLTGAGRGFAGWTLAGAGSGDVDGLPTRWIASSEGAEAVEAVEAAAHPNGTVSIDHAVVVTGSLERTTGALGAAGAEVRRVVEAGPRRQAFLWLGEVIAEVVQTGEPGDPARLWGLTLVSGDLDATVAALGGALGDPRPAVQPGRRIATLSRDAGLGIAVAVMTPHVRD